MQQRWPVISSPLHRYSRRGRKSLYKSEYCHCVKASFAQTAETIGVSRRTIINWCQRHPEFKYAQTLESVQAQQIRINKKTELLFERGKVFASSKTLKESTTIF